MIFITNHRTGVSPKVEFLWDPSQNGYIIQTIIT